MRRCFRKFLKAFAIVAIIALTIVAIFNVIVDPHRTFNLVHSPRLEAAKISRGGRIAKAEQLRRGPWDTIILGSSRVDAGIDPANPAWPTPRTFNCGLTGLSFTEEAKVFDFIETVVHPTTVVLCLDFFHFQDAAPVSEEFALSRFNPQKSAAAYYVDALWGATPTWHSILTLNNYVAKKPAEYSELGLRIKPMAPPGQSGRAAFEYYVSHAAESWRQQGPWSGDTQCMRHFELLLRSAAQHHTRLIIVIMPVHAHDLELTRCEMGSLNAFENWKRHLVQAVANAEHDAPTTKIPLWDFTGFTGYVADPVPPRNDPRPMTWYWEPSHFRKELGDLLICRILNKPAPNHDIQNFGVLIDSNNLERHLARQRADEEQFAAQCADDIRYIEQRVRQSIR
jgi:hypothetical protein